VVTLADGLGPLPVLAGLVVPPADGWLMPQPATAVAQHKIAAQSAARMTYGRQPVATGCPQVPATALTSLT
jgi:hypothetical protein